MCLAQLSQLCLPTPSSVRSLRASRHSLSSRLGGTSTSLTDIYVHMCAQAVADLDALKKVSDGQSKTIALQAKEITALKTMNAVST